MIVWEPKEWRFSPNMKHPFKFTLYHLLKKNIYFIQPDIRAVLILSAGALMSVLNIKLCETVSKADRIIQYLNFHAPDRGSKNWIN